MSFKNKVVEWLKKEDEIRNVILILIIAPTLAFGLSKLMERPEALVVGDYVQGGELLYGELRGISGTVGLFRREVYLNFHMGGREEIFKIKEPMFSLSGTSFEIGETYVFRVRTHMVRRRSEILEIYNVDPENGYSRWVSVVEGEYLGIHRQRRTYITIRVSTTNSQEEHLSLGGSKALYAERLEVGEVYTFLVLDVRKIPFNRVIKILEFD